MKDRIDPLIAERAPWLFRRGPVTDALRGLLHLGLSYDRTVAVAVALRDADSTTIMATMYDRLAQDVQATGFEHLPRQGPALIVANHPTGIADGIILFGLLARTRPDAYILANRDILRVMPQMADMIAPVEWRHDMRTHAKTRATLAFMHRAVADGRLGVIFPSGRLAKRRGLGLHERPWMASAATLARRFSLPVVPVHIRARNSALFYLFDRIHPTLRDITLFHETLNKDRQPYVVSMGEPITPTAIPTEPEAGIAMLRAATLALAGRDSPDVSLVAATRRPLLRF